MHVKYLGHNLGKANNAVDRYYSGSKAGNCDVFSLSFSAIESMIFLEAHNTRIKGDNTWAKIRNEVTQPMC